MLHSSKLIHVDAKNISPFIDNVMHNSVSLIPAPKNNRKLFKTCKNQTWFGKRECTLSFSLGLKHKSRLCRRTKNRAFSSCSDLLLPPSPQESWMKAFSGASLVSLSVPSALFFKILQKGTVLLLYWFAAWQQFSTSRQQKHGSYYLKVNAQFSEPNLSI